jgi:hypothetical protein
MRFSKEDANEDRRDAAITMPNGCIKQALSCCLQLQ